MFPSNHAEYEIHFATREYTNNRIATSRFFYVLLLMLLLTSHASASASIHVVHKPSAPEQNLVTVTLRQPSSFFIDNRPGLSAFSRSANMLLSGMLRSQQKVHLSSMTITTQLWFKLNGSDTSYETLPASLGPILLDIELHSGENFYFPSDINNNQTYRNDKPSQLADTILCLSVVACVSAFFLPATPVEHSQIIRLIVTAIPAQISTIAYKVLQNPAQLQMVTVNDRPKYMLKLGLRLANINPYCLLKTMKGHRIESIRVAMDIDVYGRQTSTMSTSELVGHQSFGDESFTPITF